MLSEALFKKIQRFHFTTKRLANDLFAGQYESAFKGRGMEFAEVREYQIGDDIRTIDWNVSARFGRPFVKVFHEERELTVILILDLSGSHLFGTKGKFKRELMAEVAGMLAFLAIRTNDKVGAILFSSEVEKYIPPKKGASHVWRLIKEIFTYEPQDLSTNIDSVLVLSRSLSVSTNPHLMKFIFGNFSINRGKSSTVPFFWIPAFAGMTGVYSIMTDIYSISSFPRTRESRTCYRDLLRCYHFRRYSRNS